MKKLLKTGGWDSHALEKCFKTMKIFLFVMILSIGQLLAIDSYSQRTKLSLDFEGTRLVDVLDEIENKTEFFFLFNEKLIDLDRKVDIHVNDQGITEILETLFKGTNVKYQIVDRKIVLSPKNSFQPLQKTVTGKVTDSSGAPLPGVTVIVKRTTQGIITDANGNYSLSNIPGDAILVFSFVGMKTQEISVAGKTDINIVLAEELIGIEEVVAVGYGAIAKKELTSAISHVSSEDFLNVASIDPTMQIQGKVSGVSITNTGSGDPNNQANIQVRGISSRSAGLGPLIVIDGVPGGNLTNINVNDIKSIDVLKDGAASAIYGTRGSNGVVLITTKSGKKDGNLYTSYHGYVSADIMKDELRPLSAQEFREYRVPKNQGVDQGGNTDWMDAVTRTGFTHSHTITFAGGTANSNYRASGDYRKSEGIDLRSDRKEYGARLSFHHTTNSGLFNFSVNVTPRAIYRNNADWSVFKAALEANPTTPVFDPENPLQYANFNGQAADFNPVELLKLEESGGETKLLDWDATVKLNLLPLLTDRKKATHSLNTQVTIAQQQNDNFDYWFRPAISTQAINSGRQGEANRKYSKSRQESLEWVGNYLTEMNGHKIKAMVGYSYQYFQYSELYAENKDFPSDVLSYNNLGVGEWTKEEGRTGMSTGKNDSRLIGFFGRVSYDYKGRYLLTASLRYEGSSKFGENNKWGYFPATSLGWRISDEPFMAHVRFVDDLKLRADLGVTGNQNFDNYRSLATMQGFGSYYYNGEYFTVWGPGKNANPDLKWEKGVNWNVGIDFSVFDHVVSGSLNYYNRRQSDLLGDYNVSVPPYLFPTTFVNVGTLKNMGIEIDLNINAMKTRKFSYQVGLVGATNQNKFVDFSNSVYTGQDYSWTCWMESPGNPGNLQQIRKGERLGNFVTWAFAGIDETGNWLVWNKENTEKIPISEATDDDKRITGNGLPKVTASLTNSFTYKNWDLTLYFRGAFGYDLYNVHDLYYGLQSAPGNVLRKAYGKNADITSGLNVLTDYFLEKGDYVKLDVVTLGYKLNLKNRWIEGLRVYATARNLATFTGFSGVDPTAYQVNGLTPGTNNGTRAYYPSSTQFIFGATVNF